MVRVLSMLSFAALAGACAPATFGWVGAGPDEAAGLARYRAAFVAAAGTRFTGTLPRGAVLDAARRARVLWLGDHHPSEALHDLQRALVSDLLAAGARPVLCLEAIGTADERAVARFLAGESSLAELCRVVRDRWPESWLDDDQVDAAFYRDLLIMARDHGLPVRALEPTPRLPLAARDAVIAAAVRRTAAEFPDRLLIAVVGQAHLLGDGALSVRTGLPDLLVGGEPTPPLATAAVPPAAAGDFVRSDAGLLWFAARLR